MEIPSNTANKQKAVETLGKPQALQVVVGTSLTLTTGGSAPAPLAPAPPPSRSTGIAADPPRQSTSWDTSTEELSLLGTIQQIV
ncbi:UNVERIFIED_CONTAM: hypothetical protein Slati_0492100 [Sesamum latifolium]|uniref:Uncharacterized protein n=1 Tax=Sesamum latifolium TaxID=2727402 RepID=A0AAW2XXA9_9LAMI